MKTLRMLMVCAVLMGVSSGAFGAVITYNLGVPFDGLLPGGQPPWLTAVFDDGGTPGSVNLSLTTTGLVPGEYVAEWLFNVDPQVPPLSLIFSPPTKTGSFADPTVWRIPNFFPAGPDGLFDIKIAFSTIVPPWRFDLGDSVSYTILGPGITAHSFNFLSQPISPVGPFPTAAKLQGVVGPSAENGGPCCDYSWITVPEPGAVVIMAAGAVGLLSRRRRRK